MLRIKTVGLTLKSDISDREEVVERVLRVLESEGVKVLVDRKRTKGLSCAKNRKQLKGQSAVDLLVVIGGDGTIFRAVRELPDMSVPLLTINRGGVGFLAEVDIDEVEIILPQLLRGKGVREVRPLLAIEVLRGKKKVFAGSAINEVVIAQGAIARLLHLQTSVHGEALATYRADGLIIATPTGSTAYSLSAGGPVVHPRLPALVLTPINPHSFTQKPIVIPGGDTVEVEVLQRENRFVDSEVSLTLDGQVYHKLLAHDRVVARMDKRTVTFLRRREDTFFATLRRKLKWGETI